MKSGNRIVSVVVNAIAIVSCCVGLCMNYMEGMTSSSDRFAILLFFILLCISTYNLLRSVKKLKDNNR